MGGIVINDDDEVAAFLRLYRNHGLVDRDHVSMWGVNDRLQPFQAVVATRVLDEVEGQVEKRIRNARQLDEGLSDLAEFVHVPQRPVGVREVYQLYQVGLRKRDELVPLLASQADRLQDPLSDPLAFTGSSFRIGLSEGRFSRLRAAGRRNTHDSRTSTHN